MNPPVFNKITNIAQTKQYKYATDVIQLSYKREMGRFV
jgi:hypothetical protein